MRISDKKFHFLKRFGTSSSGAFGDCACGVTSYDVSNYWDEDHQERIRNIEENSLTQFQTNSIEFIEINGNYFVVGCKCKTDETIFALLTEQRDDVISYLKDTQEKPIANISS